ncbi:MAG: hypothetical protein L6R40_003782 [Gallowayella cf. fulva]|nr:MAG: hypothetical protein L6R40_003782 [Xanthomendoza cf. fulva]
MYGTTDSKVVPTLPSPTVTPRSFLRKISVAGDSNSFLTALAAQERRVLELREELQKAEDDLSRFKKQWATHEAIKKRNELRHQEQLQKLEPASRASCHGDPKWASGRWSEKSPNRPFAGVNGAHERAREASERSANCRNSRRQTQRKIFAGSRHTRALSLLSKGGTTAGGQPKEVFLETGKQFVGDLREGLWTFFEDLRQATVGEEASSISPDPINKAGQVARLHGGRWTGIKYASGPHAGTKASEKTKSSKELVAPDSPVKFSAQLPSKTSNTMNGTSKEQLTRQPAETNEPEGQLNDSSPKLVNQASNWIDEDPWDVWGSPGIRDPASRGQVMSVTSGSVTPPSTERESLRSSLSSFDATVAGPPTHMSTEEPQEIPWPVLTNSPSNLRMTASTLMGEWEETLAQSTTLESAAGASPSKIEKVE